MAKNPVVNKQNQILNKTLNRELGDRSENGLANFFSQYGLKILISLLTATLAVFVGIRFFTPSQKGSLKDYYQVRAVHAKIAKANIEASALAQVDQLIKKHPETAPQYEGLLAQDLLNKGQSAASYVPSLFKRMETTLSPSFKEYAAITILISEKKYEEALARTQQLSEKLLEENNTFYLPLFNLLRQAALAEELGNKEIELATWEEWQVRTSNPETHFFMKEIFQEGAVSISDYVKYRLQALHA